jgi:probable HAF family extracellular repeat protein
LHFRSELTLSSFALAAALLALVGGAAASTVITTDLGTLGTNTSYSVAVAVNASGQVVGYSAIVGNNPYHAFSWTKAGGMIDLGTIGGFDYSQPTGVSDDGQVVGNSFSPTSSTSQRAFSWTQAGGMVDLGTFGGTFTRAASVNRSGQVVGQSCATGNTACHPFLWTQAGGMIDLGTLGGTYAQATGLNASGQVVGYSNTSGNVATHAFSWTQADGMIDLGNDLYPTGVDASGRVFGYQNYPNGTFHAFSWTKTGGLTDLGTLGGTNSYPYAVSASGQLVGGSEISGNVAGHAFSWTGAGGMIDLGTLGGSASGATGVGDSGQVVGESCVAHAFSWTKAGGMIDLGSIAGTGPSTAFGVNANGDVVGGSTSKTYSGYYHATLWETSQTPPAVALTQTPTGSNGWFNSTPAIAHVLATDTGSGVTIPVCTIDGSAVALAGTGATANTVFGDVLVVAQGEHVVDCTSTDTGRSVTGSATGTVKLDTVAPLVTYTGNATTYTVDQSINILCTASDSTSGVGSSTCADTVGPAYTFGLGPHLVSATSTDKAGNTGTGSTIFSVGVTAASLCNLQKAFTLDSAKYQSLSAAGQARVAADFVNGCGPLRALGNPSDAVNGYDGYVSARVQQGWLTQSQAHTLMLLSTSL